MVAKTTQTRRRAAGFVALGAACVLLLTACGGDSAEPTTSESGATGSAASVPVEGRQVLLDAQQLTALDQPITYPKKKPGQVTSAIITLEPGQETGWNRNRVPLYVYVLEGTLTVEYDAGVVKEYTAGTAFMEAQGVWHNGTNKREDAVRMLTVYLGAKGVKDSVQRTP